MAGDDRDIAADYAGDELLRLAARCARGERVAKQEAAVAMRRGRDVIRRLRARVAELEGATMARPYQPFGPAMALDINAPTGGAPAASDAGPGERE